jgi:hypothetical protein
MPLFRRPAFAENLYLINRSEVLPSGGALNPDHIFEMSYSNCIKSPAMLDESRPTFSLGIDPVCA